MKGDQLEINIYVDNQTIKIWKVIKHYQNMKGDQVEINIYANNQSTQSTKNMKGDQVEINIKADNQSTIKIWKAIKLK